ncbi:MAG: alpha/beta hydrolase [Saprospiraceae bacterium]|nr:alpha/beta hydrolase [Saprospiraceae bacterium]
MKKLVILSDLWGNINPDWLTHYTEILKKHFEIKYYDCRELGEIYLQEYTEEKIHQQFMNGGADRAIKNLLKKEFKSIHVLGFSIGGYIAWKSALQGLKVENITAISSTRLRFENLKPQCKIDLFYSENDQFKPENDWYIRLELKENIFYNEKHDFYRTKENAINICNEIIIKRKPNY